MNTSPEKPKVKVIPIHIDILVCHLICCSANNGFIYMPSGDKMYYHIGIHDKNFCYIFQFISFTQTGIENH